MSKFSYSIRSMRLRTLPLSLSGIILGVLMAASDYRINILAAVFLVLTAIGLQILSNLSNELGDHLSGTDTADRQGMHYSMQDGGLSTKEMKRLIAGAIVFSIICGSAMVYISFGTLVSLEALLMLLLGGYAIKSAMGYSLGRSAYGPRGLGDIYVFLFFGIISVLGGYFICTHEISTWRLLLPAGSIGAFSVAVLNVNNIRDMKTDAATRTTIAIRLGEKNARIYQTVLIALGWVFMTAYCMMKIFDPWHFIYVVTLPLYIIHLKNVWTKTGKDLDPMLPLLVVSTFLFALLTGIGLISYLF